MSWHAQLYSPCPLLRPFVESLWRVSGTGEAIHARLPTNGCIDIGFNLGAPLLVRTSTRQPETSPPTLLSTVWIEGLQTRYLDSTTTGPTSIAGCRLNALGAYRLFGPELPLLTDTLVVDEDVANAPLRELHTRLTEDMNAVELFHRLERFLLGRLNAPFFVDPRIAHVVQRMWRREVPRNLRHLSKDLGMSYTSFLQRFRRQVGTTPKRYARILRFHAARQDISRSDRPVDWPELALRHDYCDQSHLIREFQSIVALSPQEFWRRRDNLSQSVAMLDDTAR